MADGHILVVDDEAEVCELIADCLAEEGLWTVDYTTEPLRALEQVGQGLYDVIVTDLRMPDLSGYDLATQAQNLCPGIGIIAVTGYANLPSSVQALRSGFVDYLQKPFRSDEVRAAVHRALLRRRHTQVEETVANEVTHDNAVLAAENQDLRKQLELVSRELTLLQHRLAGHVADLEARCQCSDQLEGQRDIAQLQALALVTLRQGIAGDEYALVVVDHDPARAVSVARIDDEDVVVQVAERKLSRGILRAVMTRRQTALVEDAGESPILGELADWITRRGSVLVMPLVGNGVTQAVAVVRREEVGQSFGPSEVRRVQNTCGEIGRALEVAMAFRRQQAEIYAALKALVQKHEDASEETRGHSRRVARWAGDVARRFNLQEDRVERIQMAGHLHDIGKVMVRRELLNKVGPLGDGDRAELAAHSESGWELLRPIAFLSEIGDLVRWHHDAGGPAEGIGCDQQILATAEAYDELMHNGPHGPAMNAEEALARLQKDGYDEKILHALAGVALIDN